MNITMPRVSAVYILVAVTIAGLAIPPVLLVVAPIWLALGLKGRAVCAGRTRARAAKRADDAETERYIAWLVNDYDGGRR